MEIKERVFESILTENELAVYKRGRNAHSYTSAKNADIVDYRFTANMEDIPEEYAALKIILCVTTANQEVKVPEAKHEVKHRNRWILPIIGGATIAAAAAASAQGPQ